MNCIICLSELQNPETLPCCSRSFCGDCIANWLNVRSCCPLCIAPQGPGNINNIVGENSNEFDNGGLMLENQLSEIIQRFTYLKEILHLKNQASRNHKSVFPKYRLQHAEREMERIEENIDIASLAMLENDRVNATSSIQVVTELIYEVQSVLDGECEMDYQDYDDYSDYSQDEQEEKGYREERRLYEVASQGRKGNVRVNKKKNESVNI